MLYEDLSVRRKWFFVVKTKRLLEYTVVFFSVLVQRKQTTQESAVGVVEAFCGCDSQPVFEPPTGFVSSAIPYPKGAGEPRLIWDQSRSHGRALLHDSMSSGYEVWAELWRGKRCKGINGNWIQQAAAKRGVISWCHTGTFFSLTGAVQGIFSPSYLLFLILQGQEEL